MEFTATFWVFVGIYCVAHFVYGLWEGFHGLRPSGLIFGDPQPRQAASPFVSEGWVQEPLQRSDLREWERTTGCTLETRDLPAVYRTRRNQVRQPGAAQH